MQATSPVNDGRTIIGYELVDKHTGQVIGRCQPAQRNRLRARADRLDNQYGSYRYFVHAVWND